jgi:diguanylate cyclase (GGDEF)-like protein
MPDSFYARVHGALPLMSSDENTARGRLALTSLFAMFLIATASAGSIWRYEVALHHSDLALAATADALRVQSARTFFWQERETMNEYLLRPVPALIADIAAEQNGFDGATKNAGDGGLGAFSRRANASFVKTFMQNRRVAGIGYRAELPVVTELNAAEAGVLQPVDELENVFLGQVQERRAARGSADSQALIAALLGALIAVAATGILAKYSRRLLGSAQARRLTEQRTNASEHEYTEMLQGAETEEEADELLKRQVERSIRSSEVVVLRRNNSADRLLATTEPDAQLAERLTGAEPRSCLAVRFGRTHEREEGAQPLARCALCSQGDGYSTCKPLLVGGEVLGAALVRHSASLTEGEQRALTAAVAQSGPVLANLRSLVLARFRAATDALTGLPNSREVQDTLKRMAAHASRTMSPMAALMLDLDHFKQINDKHGHAVGDDVLAALGSALQASVRASDFVGRYGGEEFVLLLPDTGREEAEIVAEKVRAAVAAINVSGVTQAITASIGLAVLPDDATDSVALLRNADRALYSAKSNGRNRVEPIRSARVLSDANAVVF